MGSAGNPRQPRAVTPNSPRPCPVTRVPTAGTARLPHSPHCPPGSCCGPRLQAGEGPAGGGKGRYPRGADNQHLTHTTGMGRAAFGCATGWDLVAFWGGWSHPRPPPRPCLPESLPAQLWGHGCPHHGPACSCVAATVIAGGPRAPPLLWEESGAQRPVVWGQLGPAPAPPGDAGPAGRAPGRELRLVAVPTPWGHPTQRTASGLREESQGHHRPTNEFYCPVKVAPKSSPVAL